MDLGLDEYKGREVQTGQTSTRPRPGTGAFMRERAQTIAWIWRKLRWMGPEFLLHRYRRRYAQSTQLVCIYHFNQGITVWDIRKKYEMLPWHHVLW